MRPLLNAFMHLVCRLCIHGLHTFHDIVGAIASFGKGYKAPNYEKLRTTLLDKEKDRVCSRLSMQ